MFGFHQFVLCTLGAEQTEHRSFCRVNYRVGFPAPRTLQTMHERIVDRHINESHVSTLAFDEFDRML